MEGEATKKYINCLNRNSLMEFLREQKFKTEAELLDSKDIDGERFLKFTELDLVQWGLKVNQKKLLVNCRNKLLNQPEQVMAPPKKGNSRLQKQQSRDDLNYLEPIKVRAQRPLPVPPKQTDSYSGYNKSYDAKKPLNRVNSLKYVVMGNKGQAPSEEPSEDYVDMGSKLNVNETFASISPKGRALKIPERPKLNFNSKSTPQDSTPQDEAAHLPYIQEKKEIFTRSKQISDSFSDDEFGIYEEPQRIINTTVTTTSEFSSSSYSPSQGFTEVKKSPSLNDRKCPPVPARPGLQTSRDVQDDDDIEKFISEIESFHSESLASIRPKIQDIPLPPIPILNKDSNAHSIEPKTSEKPKPLPKPAVRNQQKNLNENNPPELEVVYDFHWVPPPLEFSDELDVGATANIEDYRNLSEHIWNAPDEYQLPKPPMFNGQFDKVHIGILKDLDQYDESSSSEEEFFNPNNYDCYRNTDRKGAKQLIQEIKNLKDNTYLIRPTMKKPYFLGLTIYHEKYYYNLGIHRDTDGFFYCESYREQEVVKFSTLSSFIRHYKYNALIVKRKDGRIAELYLQNVLANDIY